MTHPVPEWAGTAVSWAPEVVGLDPVGTVPDAGLWSTPFSDFAPLSDPIAMELRAESISQLIHGDALRCGEAECIESAGSGTGADIVAGRDRVRVHGRLREHTGGELAAMVAHLDTSVGGSLEVHAGHDDTVALAGHMRESCHGGTAVVAAVADDLAAGGGVRVTMPLDLWVHGLMGVEERAGTCAADVVVVELAGTHYEREYNGGVHMARLARFAGAMHVTAKTGFFPLMEVSCGVRNLIAGSGEGDGEPASPTPPPAEGAGTAAAAATLVRDTGRTAEGAADVGVRGQDAADLRHASALSESEAGEDLRALHQVSPDLGELLASGDGFRDIAGSADELGELNHSTDAAEQLASLRSGESVGTGGAMTAGQQQALDDLLSAIDMRVAEATGGLDTPSRTGDSVESSWTDDFVALQVYLESYTERGNTSAAEEYRRAIDHVVDEVLAAYFRFAAEGDELSSTATDADRVWEAYGELHNMLVDAQQMEDHARADDIRQALEHIDALTCQHVLDLSDIDHDGLSWAAESSSWSIGWDTPIGSDVSHGSGVGGSISGTSGSSGGSVPSNPVVHVDESNEALTITQVQVADFEGRVILTVNEYDRIRNGGVVLKVLDSNGDVLAQSEYTIHVPGHIIGLDGDLYATVVPHPERTGQAAESDGFDSPDNSTQVPDDDASPSPSPSPSPLPSPLPSPRFEDLDEVAHPDAQSLEGIPPPIDPGYERVPSPAGEGLRTAPLRLGGEHGRIGFGRQRLPEASSPGFPAEGTPGFGRAQAQEPAYLPFTQRDRLLRQLSEQRGLSRTDVFDLHDDFVRVSAARHFDRDTTGWSNMALLIGHLRMQAQFAGDQWDFYRVFSDRHHLEALINLLELLKASGNVQAP